MNLLGINADLIASLVGGPFVGLYTQVPLSPELPAIYCGFPQEMTDFASGGSCTLNHSLSVVVTRANEEEAQSSLSELLSVDLILRIVRYQSEFWSDVAFKSINQFRATTFGTTECLAADLNLLIRTT